MSGLEQLSADHEHQVEMFLRFAAMKRGQHLKEVDIVINETRELRVTEMMYTKDEVETILEFVNDDMRRSVEKELANANHVTALLMRMLMAQGDAAGLALNVDVNQLENEMLLGKIKDMELTAIAKPSSNFQARKGGESLPKAVATGADTRVVAERDQLREDVKQAKQRIAELQEEARGGLAEKNAEVNRLAQQLQQLQQMGSQHQEDSADSAGVAAAALEAKDREIHDLQRNVKKLNKKHADLVLQAQAAAKAAEKAAAQQAAVANNEAGREMRHQMDDADRELQYMRDELREKATELEAVQAESDVKLQESKQFVQMKKLMQQKSQQLTQLRKRLAVYEPPDEGVADGDI